METRIHFYLGKRWPVGLWLAVQAPIWVARGLSPPLPVILLLLCWRAWPEVWPQAQAVYFYTNDFFLVEEFLRGAGSGGV